MAEPMRIGNERIRSEWISIIASVFFLAVSVSAFSLDRDRSITQMYYTFLSEKDGAPSQIGALAQTADGYLWIGSSQGLFRFDGVRFEEYKPQPGVEMPSHLVYALMATPDGGLWVAFEPVGFGFIKDGALTVFSRPEEQPPSPIHCFARDEDGTIWAGTETGLVRREGDRWVSVGPDWNFTPEMIRYLLIDRAGTLWVATINRVAFLKRGSKRFEPGGLLGTGVTTLSEAPDGKVWFADDGSGTVAPLPKFGQDARSVRPSIAADGLRELLFDRDGALWITRADFGLVRIRYPERLSPRVFGLPDAEVESFGAKDGFTAGFASKIFEDREGNIWIGCSNGLIRLRHNDVVPVKLPERYQNLTLVAGDHADLWVGSNFQAPLLHIQGNELTPQKTSGQESSVVREPDGDIWWGCRTGLWLQRGTSFQFFPLPREAMPDWMYDMMRDPVGGGLWVRLGDVGFIHFREGVWDLHAWPAGAPTEGTFRYATSASYNDASGALWLGYTSGDLYRLVGGHATGFSQKDGPNLGRIKVIRGHGSHIWVGGELGLEFFENGRFEPVSVAGDQQLGAVSGIVETTDGSLWLNEMRGIVHIAPGEVRQFIANPNHRVSYRRFTYLDGLPGAPQMSFADSTSVETSDGHIWFATDDGLAWIDPAHLRPNPLPPPVSILSASSQGGFLPARNGIRFPAGTHNVEITFTALSLSIPERVQFRYRLERIDTDWHSATAERQADYSNLGPGQYRFRVIAANNDGVWNETGASLSFSIAPAWYQTLWFRILCAAAFLGFLWMLHHLRIWQLRRREKELREVIATIPTFAWTALPNGTVDYLNRHYEDYTGLPIKKGVGLSWTAVVHPEDLKRHMERFRSAMATGELFEVESRFRRADGQYRWFLTRAVPLRDSHGRIARWFGTSIEIEDRKRAEQLQADLSHIHRMSTMSEMAASLAHEIKQPIGAAVTNAEACLRLLDRKEPDLPDAREAALEMTKDARRAAEIIDHVRLLYEKGNSQQELVDINKVVAEMLIMLRDQASRRSVTMRTELDPGLAHVMADRVQMQQVFMNLMLNGIEAMKDTGGVLSIRSQLTEGGQLLISISDTGEGLPAEKADEIFNAFFTTKAQGTGLGLAITRSILESHGGRVWATANAGRGTTFYFTLPIRTIVSA
jgi:PAS domain S-box-containing protein